MNKIRSFLALFLLLCPLGLLLSLPGCSSTPSKPTVKATGSNPSDLGDYTSNSPYYFTRDGVRYGHGTDGNWYALRRAAQPAGFMAGSSLSVPECWIRADLSLNQCYLRDRSFSQDIQPTFVPY